MDKNMRKDLEKDGLSIFNMKMERSECYYPITTYTVEIPTQQQNAPEMKQAKQKERDNFMKCNVFEEIEDEGKDEITSIWVILEKMKHDGQKVEYKARLLVRGLQEMDDLQFDSPTALRASAKLFYSIAANEGCHLRLLDIWADFL